MHVVTLSGIYDLRLVSLSVFIALLAAYAALDLAGRITASRGVTRSLWLVGGAFALGFGIWSMHYIGMEAFRLPVRVHLRLANRIPFDGGFNSCLRACPLYRKPQQNEPRYRWRRQRLHGAGIATMHYVGMEAMRLPPMCHYNLRTVALSVILAVVISFVALTMTFSLRDKEALSWRKVLCRRHGACDSSHALRWNGRGHFHSDADRSAQPRTCRRYLRSRANRHCERHSLHSWLRLPVCHAGSKTVTECDAVGPCGAAASPGTRT